MKEKANAITKNNKIATMIKKRKISIKYKLIIACSLSVIAISALLYFTINEYYMADNMLEAKKSLKEGKTEEAMLLLEKALEQDSSNVEAYKLLAGIYRDKGNYLEAAKLWVSIEKLDPFDISAIHMQAENLLSMGAYKATIELLNSEPAIKNFTLEDQLILAKAYTGSGQLSKAEKILKPILTNNKNNQNALLIKGNIEFFRKRIDSAINFFLKIKDNDDAIKSAKLVGLGNCYEYKGLIEQAQNYYIQAFKASKHSYQAGLILADFYRKNKEFDKSINILTPLFKKYPSSNEIIRFLADMYSITNNTAALHTLHNEIHGNGIYSIKLKYYIKALIAFSDKQYSETIKYFDWSGKNFQSGSIYLLCSLYSNAKLKNTVDTLKLMNNIFKKSQKPTNIEDIIYFLLVEAEEALNNNNYNFTYAIANLITQYDFQNIPAHILLMWCYFSEKRLHEATLEAEIVLKNQKNNIDALEVKGRILLNRNKYLAALREFDSIIKYYSNLSTGYYWSGITLMEQKKFSKSLLMLNKALRLTPSNTLIINSIYDLCILSNNQNNLEILAKKLINSDKDSIQAIGYSFMAELSKQKNDLKKTADYYSEAIKKDNLKISYYLHLSKTLYIMKDFKKSRQVLLDSIKIDPKNKYTLFELAYSYYQNKEYNKAVVTYQQLLKLYPEWSLPLVNLSSLLSELNKNDIEALNFAQKAVYLSPNTWFARLNLGEIYYKRKQYYKAIPEFKKTLDLNPKNKDAAKYLNKIELLIKQNNEQDSHNN